MFKELLWLLKDIHQELWLKCKVYQDWFFYLTQTWDYIDRQLCVRIPIWKLRIWYHQLWDRQDEFHPCYTKDVEALWNMNYSQAGDYSMQIAFRRHRVHERTLV
jgi:hypothetical protein